MDLSFENIKTELKELDKDGNAETLKGEVAFQNRDALKSIANSAKGVTRSNTKWRRCEYVIIGIRDNESVDDNLALKGWRALAYSHGDQTLILQNVDKSWTLYNSKGEVIGGNFELEDLIKKIKVLHNLKSSLINRTKYQQIIYFGAPGTGKSNEIKNLTGENGGERRFKQDFTFRTTFHPDSDYASFVGAFKPYTQNRTNYIPDQVELDALFKMEVNDDSNRKHSIYHYGQKYWEALQTIVLSEKICLGDTEFDDNDITLLKLGIKVGRENSKSLDSKIIYSFRPQAFLKAYISAWLNPKEDVALVIEEINRGNCAQIFGDIFQLLDREKEGLSKYPIESDIDMQGYIASAFNGETDAFGTNIIENQYDAGKKALINENYSMHYNDAFDKIKNGEILALPMNLSILATMNTSDQSLFPMDSAFKRRWEWIYEPIVEGKKEDGTGLGWKIEVDDTHIVDWWNFLQKINSVIYSLTSSEDKQLGYFFCQPDGEDGVTISKKLFVGKVIFYLWNEIFKDYAFEHDVCKKENNGGTLYFADFYEGKNRIKQISLETFFRHLDEFGDKDVKLIEEKVSDTSTPNTPADGANDGEEPAEEVRSEQTEETTTENSEA